MLVEEEMGPTSTENRSPVHSKIVYAVVAQLVEQLHGGA